MRASLSRTLFRPSQRFSPKILVSNPTKRSAAFCINSKRMAAQPTTTSEVISEIAQAEDGPYKGSTAAQMQSQVTKARNFEQAAEEVAGKMQTEPEKVTSADAAYMKSREARATGLANPPADSISADAERLAALNEGATKQPKKVDLNPAQQSMVDRLENFEQAAEEVAPKMATRPDKVTPEDAAYLQSREQRAFGEESQGGIASQAKSMADQNLKKGNV